MLRVFTRLNERLVEMLTQDQVSLLLLEASVHEHAAVRAGVAAFEQRTSLDAVHWIEGSPARDLESVLSRGLGGSELASGIDALLRGLPPTGYLMCVVPFASDLRERAAEFIAVASGLPARVRLLVVGLGVEAVAAEACERGIPCLVRAAQATTEHVVAQLRVDALDETLPSVERGVAFLQLGMLDAAHRRWELAHDELSASVRVLDAIGHPAVGAAYHALADVERTLGADPLAVAGLEVRALERSRDRDRVTFVGAAMAIARASLAAGQPESANRVLDEAHIAARALPSGGLAAEVALLRGDVLAALGDAERARSSWVTAHALGHVSGDPGLASAAARRCGVDLTPRGRGCCHDEARRSLPGLGLIER